MGFLILILLIIGFAILFISSTNETNNHRIKQDPPKRKRALDENEELITGAMAIERLKNFNKIGHENDPEQLTKIDQWNEEGQAYMFTLNCTYAYLNEMKERYDGDINDLNLCAHHVMLMHYAKKLLDNMKVDGNAIIPNRSQLLYDHLVFTLTDTGPLTGADHPYGLNRNWQDFWDQTLEQMYSSKQNQA